MSIFFARLVCRANFGQCTVFLKKKEAFWKDAFIYTSFHCRFSTTTSEVVHNNEELLGVNHLKDGNDSVLRPDEEYPDWLWQLNRHKQTMEECDPQSRTYRRLLRKKERREENERRKMKRF